MQGRDTGRLAALDGLRGCAVLLVVLFHAWSDPLPAAWDRIVRWDGTPADRLFSRGYEGVSLFLVLSGCCLAYPLLRRRQQGTPAWFVPSQFFARRCLRILPPYYAALLVLLGIRLLWLRAPTEGQRIELRGPFPGWGFVADHLLLVQNLTPDAERLNGAFWSLGLEWQWYWLFPVALLGCLRWPVPALLGCLVLAGTWHTAVHDLWGIGALPARLFEFVCGIAAAHLLVTGWRHARAAALTVLLLLAVLVLHPAPLWPALLAYGLDQPLYGLGFAALVVLACLPGRLNRALSCRLLTRLGAVSYSVYLVHYPVIQAIDTGAPAWLGGSWLLLPSAAGGGIVAGALAFHLVERWCVDPRLGARVLPRLVRVFRWTDRLYRLSYSAPPVPAPGSGSLEAVARSSAPSPLAGS